MQASQGIVKGDVLQRIAGIGFIAGGIGSLAGNIVFPRADDPNIIGERLIALAENESLSQIALLVLILAFWALFVGGVGVYRALSTGTAAVWVRLGFYGVLAATTIATVALATGLATTSAAVDWVSAGSTTGSTEYAIAAGLSELGNSVFNVMIVGNWLGLMLVGIGMVSSDTYPKWLGWVLIVLSAVVVAAGVPRLLMEPNQVLAFSFAIPAGLTSVWALVLGGWVTRKAW